MLSQTSQSITFHAFYTKSKVGAAPSSAPTINIERKGSGSLVVTGGTTSAGLITGHFEYTLSSGSDSAADDYFAVFHTSDTSVDVQDLPGLWIVGNSFTELEVGGAAPGSVDGLPVLVAGAGTPVVPSQPTSFGGNVIPAGANGYMLVDLSGTYSLVWNATSGLPITSGGGYEANQSPDYYILQTPGQKIKTNGSGFVYSFDTLGNVLPTAAQNASAVWKDTTSGDFTVAGSIGKLLNTFSFTGTNVNANTQATAATLTFNLTGNLSGSVGSVTGDVGGSVGSVTAGVTLTVGTITSIQSGLATSANQTTINNNVLSLGAPMQAGTAVVLASVQSNYAPSKAGDQMALTSATHTAVAADVQTGLAAQGYSTTRAGYLDVLNGLIAAVWSYGTRTLTAISDSPTVQKLLTMIQQVGTSGNYQFTAQAEANAPQGSGGGGGTTSVAITPLQASFANPIPCRKALDVTQYSAQAFVFVFNNLDGTPTNLAGHTLQFVAATSAGTTVITYNTGTSNLVIGGTDNNNVTLTFAPADTATAQPLTYTLWDVTESGEPVPLAGDRCTINSAVAPT